MAFRIPFLDELFSIILQTHDSKTIRKTRLTTKQCHRFKFQQRQIKISSELTFDGLFIELTSNFVLNYIKIELFPIIYSSASIRSLCMCVGKLYGNWKMFHISGFSMNIKWKRREGYFVVYNFIE